MAVSEPATPARRDRLRELLDAVVDAENAAVGDMARSSFSSEFHFSREIRRLTGEAPAALRRRIILERAAWRLRRGEPVSAVAAQEGWSSPEVFSRAFRRTFGVPPSRAAEVDFRVPAPNGLHFHPPQSLWLDGDDRDDEAGPGGRAPDTVRLMVAHDIADTAYLIDCATALSEHQWRQELWPGHQVLDWDGPEPGVGAVLCATVWTKAVWLATIEGRDYPERVSAATATPVELAEHHREVGQRWTAMVAECSAAGRMGDTVIDALCDPPESFQLNGIVAHVLTYAGHRRELARTMLARLGVPTRRGDPLEWMREN
ncbi:MULTISPECIES: helix-turn-helix domain-containing protein [Mycobacteriaceae]|uniref:helix-turn-helix domain-containing protein n=1 Tax=Mycobacteriaceae TaxID=1762 RepID=UPI0007FE6EB1|nr:MULTISPECIES: helix-turn-helix domain-containing protein [Mycobacteriaceae]MCK0177196.1 helix-turn-helix domain-containing protein [Mycolicibacterium sp. F2034L]OBB59514.1 AraC family transcriptional regulator [Mycobacterium sp. 852013-51886_SCH5428379]